MYVRETMLSMYIFSSTLYFGFPAVHHRQLWSLHLAPDQAPQAGCSSMSALSGMYKPGASKPPTGHTFSDNHISGGDTEETAAAGGPRG